MTQEGGPTGLILLCAFAMPRISRKPPELTALATSNDTLRTSRAELRFMTMPSR